MARKSAGGPAADPETLILASLASGSKHGYAIMSDVEGFAGVKIGPGTLYTALTRLMEKKMIAAKANTGRQRPYELTRSGERRLREQLRDMKRLAAIGLARLEPA